MRLWNESLEKMQGTSIIHTSVHKSERLSLNLKFQQNILPDSDGCNQNGIRLIFIFPVDVIWIKSNYMVKFMVLKRKNGSKLQATPHILILIVL